MIAYCDIRSYDVSVVLSVYLFIRQLMTSASACGLEGNLNHSFHLWIIFYELVTLDKSSRFWFKFEVLQCLFVTCKLKLMRKVYNILMLGCPQWSE